MPTIYAKHHDQILENALANKDHFTPKERFLFGRSKSNYVFPVNIHIDVIFLLYFS